MLVRVGYDTHITRFSGFGLDMLDNVRKMAECQVGHNHANGTRGVIAQTHGKGVRTVSVFFSQLKDFLSEIGTNAVLALQRT